jgi:diguanylate cyclase (GGDEF)-like protein/PAS domain S-box-containing protein
MSAIAQTARSTRAIVQRMNSQAAGAMRRRRLLVLARTTDVRAVRAALDDSRDSRFTVESAGQCREALEKLVVQDVDDPISAVAVDLFLPDSQGIETLETLLRAAPGTPILVLSRRCDEPVAIQALQRGAQDYLLLEHLDGYSLPKALTCMLERAAHADDLLRAFERAQVTLNSIGDAVVSVNAAGNITYLNPVAEDMTGWPASEASNRPLEDVVRIIDAETREPVPSPLALAMRHDTTVGLSANCLLIRRDGHESAIEDTASPIRDRHGRVTGAVIVFHDVGAARAMSVRMSQLAQHDVLTGLPNRLLLGDRLARAIAAARRHDRSLAVLFLDLDRFKRINDSLGHAAGDEVLQSVSRRLVASVRSSDTVSRQGGDEFVVLLPEVACPEDAAFSAQKVLAAIAVPYRITDRELLVTASVGIAVYPTDGTDAETLLKRADFALLRAKARGRGRYLFAMAAATASQVALKASWVKPAPDGNQFPELPRARV